MRFRPAELLRNAIGRRTALNKRPKPDIVFAFEARMPNATQLTPGEAVAQRTITAYTLAPEQLRKSEALHRIDIGLTLASTLLEFAVLAALIAVRFIPRLQRLVGRLPERFARRRFVQAAIFVPGLLLTLSIFQLPIRI